MGSTDVRHDPGSLGPLPPDALRVGPSPGPRGGASALCGPWARWAVPRRPPLPSGRRANVSSPERLGLPPRGLPDAPSLLCCQPPRIFCQLESFGCKHQTLTPARPNGDSKAEAPERTAAEEVPGTLAAGSSGVPTGSRHQWKSHRDRAGDRGPVPRRTGCCLLTRGNGQAAPGERAQIEAVAGWVWGVRDSEGWHSGF